MLIIGCGRIGTIHEFTVAYEDKKPIGILEGDWIMDETIQLIMERSHRQNNKVIFDSDPKRLIERIREMVKKDRMETIRAYKNTTIFEGEGDVIS